jgi:hypothetical protein
MKYLKNYKIFESNFNIEDIQDILLELEDSRVKGQIVTTSGKFKTYILFHLNDIRDYNGFYFNEISDCVFRLKDYLGDNIKSCSYLSVEEKQMGSSLRVDLDLKDESKLTTLLDGEAIEKIIIQLNGFGTNEHLKKFNESNVINIPIDEFVLILNEELKNIDFKIVIEYAEHIGYILEINYFENGETYMDFDLDDFSIKKIKKECNKNLDTVQNFNCSEMIKDNYDLLCTTILTFLDENNYGELTPPNDENWTLFKL